MVGGPSMKSRNYVVATLLAALYMAYSSPSVALLQAPGAFQPPAREAHKRYRPGADRRYAPRAYSHEAPGGFRRPPRAADRRYAHGAYWNHAHRAYLREAPEAYELWDPKPHGAPCGINGLYSDGTGTCCSRIQTNPPSCQPPPLGQRQQ